jgi:hypothetical protein
LLTIYPLHFPPLDPPQRTSTRRTHGHCFTTYKAGKLFRSPPIKYTVYHYFPSAFSPLPPSLTLLRVQMVKTESLPVSPRDQSETSISNFI